MSTGKTFEASTVAKLGYRNPYVVQMPEPTPEHELTTEAKRTHFKPGPRPHPWDVVIPPGSIMNFGWGTMSTGHCQMDDAHIWIYPNGQLWFTAYTSTSSSGDVWIINWIKLHDASGNQVGDTIGKHDGQNMVWEDNSYPFTFNVQITGGISGARLLETTGATMNSHC
jgi:hypothetical protein